MASQCERLRWSKIMFRGEVAPFDDGEGGTAYGRCDVVTDLRFSGAVHPGFSVLHYCGVEKDTLDIVTPMRTFPNLKPAVDWIKAGCP